MKIANLRIIGSGLIGTSIALKAIELGLKVDLVDADATAERLARDLIAQNQITENKLESIPDLVVVATPPIARVEVLLGEMVRFPNATFIDVASVMNDLQLKIEGFPGQKKNFIASHPIAGREISGAEGARSDLFQGRAWVIAPLEETEVSRVEQVEEFIIALGATPYRLEAHEHDALFAAISHLPQAVSIALATSLSETGDGISLAGQGLRDMLRLADSDSRLWQEIFSANRKEVIASLTRFEASLSEVKAAISQGNESEILRIFEAAAEIKSQIGGKHGSRPRQYKYVNIVIDDRPGQLAAIFNECAAIAVNVEDLSLEHSPQQLTGLIRLALSESDAVRLHSHLEVNGWRVHF